MDEIELARRTIAMLHSMVESGECHTTRSREMKNNAMEALKQVKNCYIQSVSGSLTMKVEQMEFIPEEPYSSDVISWEKGNIWELHELLPDIQNIEIRVNKNYR